MVTGGIIGGLIGWIVTTVGCRPGTCAGLAGGVALLSGMVTAGGVLVVAVLVIRSLAEWREAATAGEEPPDPGCELPQGNSDQT